MKQNQILSLFVLILVSNLFLMSNSRRTLKSQRKSQVNSAPEIQDYSINQSKPLIKHFRKHTKKNKNKVSRLAFTEKSSRYINPYRKSEMEQVFNDNSYEGWLTVQADTLGDSKRYPNIPGVLDPAGKIPLDSESKVINKLWTSKNQEIPSKYYLWARLRGRYVYFSNDNKSLNFLFYVHFDKVTGVENLKNEDYCLNIFEAENKWTLCSTSEPQINKWACYFTATVNNTDLKKDCDSPVITPVQTQIVERRIEQPFIVIPVPQEYCNSKWDYEENGNNWQCLCKDGAEQSPIDLPPPNKAIDSSKSKPIFDYVVVGPLHTDSGLDGKVKSGTPIRIEHDKGALKIFHANFGKVVTLDGTVYIAEEIVFHTPSEHTINGEKYPMEMQVVHRAKSRGDYGKQLILSFLFQAKVGIYNKFIDSLDFFIMPNPHEKSKRLFEKLYIPNVLLNNEDGETSLFKPFSFYTYQGSMTAPPCSEKVIHLVVSEPIKLSPTVIEMFKEALREPDFQDPAGNIIQAKPSSLSNARVTQPLNGRSVFHYDHSNYGLPTITKKEMEPQPRGHYEKQTNESTEYFFVEGNEPSRIPGAIVVSDDEAKSNK